MPVITCAVRLFTGLRGRPGAGMRRAEPAACKRAYRAALYKPAHSQYERGNATGQMAEMARIGCPGDFRIYWFRADAGRSYPKDGR